MNNTRLLVIIIVLQTLILAGQWLGPAATSLPAAQAGGAGSSDPASRQLEMIDSLKSIDGKLDRLVTVLEGGKLQVKIADDKNAR